ncbi:hypothetical protein U1839_24010 [Sphingomonas sp. RT2P30]|uniref:hypothetical protein n=1 Tax=Parasphingomonas halimpatiens TaxID=3096162 RepID=UPI002FC8E79F
MRRIRIAVLAGGATLLLAGAAMATSHDWHVMKVALPDGSEARITYQGDVAPQIRVAGGPSTPVAFVPLAGFDMAPFAEMDRVAAMMDRQADLALQRIAMMQRAAQAGEAAEPLVAGKATPGVVSYSYVSTVTSEGGCTRTVTWRSDGANEQPKMTKTSAGTCAGASENAPAQPLKAVAPAAAAPLPKTRT